MSAAETETNVDPVLTEALAREDGMDDAWHTGGCVGPPPRRDTCHPCADWADHTHQPTTGVRVELTPAELADATERAMERGALSDMAHDPDEAAWGLYERLQSLGEVREPEVEP